MFSLTLQKPRVLQMQGVKGEAVVVYADPLTTRQRRASAADAVSSAFPKGKQHGCFSGSLDITRSAFHKITQKDRKERLLLLF
jgi:hypothetical protein